MQKLQMNFLRDRLSIIQTLLLENGSTCTFLAVGTHLLKLLTFECKLIHYAFYLGFLICDF